MDEFPPNSDASKSGRQEEKKIEPVISGGARRRKKPLRKRFSETFMSGDPRSAMQYVLFDVMLPAAQDMMADAGRSYIDKLIFGDKRRRGATAPQAGPTGYVQYHRMTQPSPPQRSLSRQARARHDFDEIVLQSRTEAEEVIDRLFDLVGKYDQASISDLYELVGFDSAHTDNKWGWTDLRGAGVARIREGYLLDLPEPQPLG
jgi:hypothetical protein